MLAAEQKAHLDVVGFLVIRQLFSLEEVAVIAREFEAAMMEDRDGRAFDEQKRQTVKDWFLGRAPVEFLANDERVHGPIQQLLGPGYAFLNGNDGNFYVGDTGWHPDLGWDPHIPEGRNHPNRIDGKWRNHYTPRIKVAFYLDPVGKDTGCLRVIPGAHRSPFHEQVWSLHKDVPETASGFESVRPKLLEMWEQTTGDPEGGERFLSDPDMNHFGMAPRDIPSYPIESEPGDAVFFSHQMWHSSFGGRVGRRMFTLRFAGAMDPEAAKNVITGTGSG